MPLSQKQNKPSRMSSGCLGNSASLHARSYVWHSGFKRDYWVDSCAVTVTGHGKLLFLEDWKALLKKPLRPSLPCSGTEVKLNELTPYSHVGLYPNYSCDLLVGLSVQSPSPDTRGWTKWRNQKTALTDLRWDLRHTLPRIDALLPKFHCTLHFLWHKEQTTLRKSSNMKFCCQNMAGSDFLCNTKTQMFEDGLDPMHGKNKGLGVPLCVLW